MSDLRCPYCGGSLYIECEYVGSGYLSENRPVAIVCNGAERSACCDAEWETDGTLRTPGREVAGE